MIRCTIGRFLLGATLVVAPCLAQDGDVDADLSGVEMLTRDAAAVAPLIESELAARFVKAAADLPRLEEERTIYLRRADRTWLTQEDFALLPEDDRDAFSPIEVDEWFHYTTRYGSSMAYGRLVDLLGQHGVDSFDGKRVLDYGFGALGHLAIMATLGADVTGFDPDSMLIATYAGKFDDFDVERAAAGQNAAGDARSDGHVRLVFDQLVDDKTLHDAVANETGTFDIFMSKNTLKRGYVHPERDVDPRMTIDIGADDATYLGHVHDLLKPGGLFVIYNLSPKRSAPDEPYIPWSDGRCPFDRDELKAAGFEILAYDVDDASTARDMARALGWGEQGMDVESDLFAEYTVLQAIERK